jgi:hypothetical protein
MKFADILLPKIAGKLGNIKLNNPIPTPVNNPVPDLPVANVVNEPVKLEILDSIEENLLTQIGKNLVALLGFAKKDAPVSVVSDFLVGHLQEKEYERIQNYLKQKGSTKILEVFIELRPYEKWVTALVSDIINFYDETNKEIVENEIKSVGESETTPDS